MIGTLLNERYLLQAQIGEGGMATVYLAEDRVSQRKVALKMISTALLDKPELLKRFKREFSACSKVKHKNIISLFEMGVTQSGEPFYTMEFLPHPSLSEVISDVGPIDESQALRIIIQLTKALEHCHSLGVIHRDVKPDNIIVTPKGRLMLVDFGLAADAEQTALTADGAVLGTPHYMAPEVVKGQAAKEAADIYAVGAVAYEMLAGHRPIKAESLQEAMMAILCGQIEPITQLRPNLHPLWQEVIGKAMALELDERYPSMSKLLEGWGRLWQLHAKAEEERESKLSQAKEQLHKSLQTLGEEGLVAKRYRIVKKLGEGGMATVFEAQDVKSRKTVAMKVMSSQLTEVAGLGERFVREFNTCQKLESDNIVKLYEMGKLTSGQPFYTMEFLPHPSVEEILQGTKEPLPEERVHTWMVQLAKAMVHYEAAGVLHRDIKGANVIITNEERLVLVDFGLAYDEDASKLTRTGAILGTPYFLAPELLTGNRASIASDIYSVGVLLYECLTGSLPFKNKTMESLLISILNGEYTPLEELRPELAARWSPILARCLARNPKKRYGNAKDFLSHLQGKTSPKKKKAKLRPRPKKKSEPKVIVKAETEAKSKFFHLLLLFGLVGILSAFFLLSKKTEKVSKVLKPIGPMKLEFVAAREDGNQLSLKWKGVAAQSLLILRQDGSQSSLELARPIKGLSSVLVDGLDEDVKDIRLLVRRGERVRKVSLRDTLRKETSAIVDALQLVDPRLLMAARLKTNKDIKSQLEQLLQETSAMDEYERAVALSPLLLGTSLLSFNERKRFHEGLMRVWVFYVANAVRKDRIRLSIPIPQFASYSISNSSAGRVIKEVVLLSKYLRIGEKPLVRRPESPIQKHSMEFTLVDLPQCRGCELKIHTDNGLHDGAMSLALGSRFEGLCYGSPIIPKANSAPSDQIVYQRIPKDALKAGRNKLVIAHHALYRGRSSRTVGVRKITLRFLQ